MRKSKSQWLGNKANNEEEDGLKFIFKVKKMNDDIEIEKQIMHTHDLFWDSLAKRDPATRFSICDDDITFIGTGLEEQAENKAAYMEINNKGIEQSPNPFTIEFLWKRLSHVGNIAWVESEVVWKQEIGETIFRDRIRSTTILKYEKNKWLIVHVHGSSPDYRFQGGNYMTNADTIIRNNELERQVFERTDELNKTLKNLQATQKQLVQSEKMASLGELTAGIAHEIQNPLNFVNNFSEVNKELIAEMREEIEKGNYEEAKEIAKYVEENEEKINHHGKRAGDIVKGMLQHSRTSTGVKEPTDINALADEYLRLAYHGFRAKDKYFNAKMETDFDERIGKINIISQDIGRVLLNLISNAFYAVNEKAQSPGLKASFDPTVTIVTRKLEGKVEIGVSDNGNGIPQNIIDKIFQPFFTTKPTGQGTGLGLSLSYDIVKAQGGEIKVESTQEKGTEFIIVLPIS